MAKRKTAIDRAIEGIDRDIEQVEGQLAVLHATRARLVAQQVPDPKNLERHHPARAAKEPDGDRQADR